MLDALGPQGYLVNVSRGAVVDEAALVAAPWPTAVWQAPALDVFDDEPHVPEALRKLRARCSRRTWPARRVETRKHMADLVLANLDAYLQGRPLPATPF